MFGGNTKIDHDRVHLLEMKLEKEMKEKADMESRIQALESTILQWKGMNIEKKSTLSISSSAEESESFIDDFKGEVSLFDEMKKEKDNENIIGIKKSLKTIQICEEGINEEPSGIPEVGSGAKEG